MDLTTLLPLGVWRLNKLFTLFLKCHPKVHSNTSKSWHLFTFVSHASSVILSYTRYPTPYGCRDFYNSCTKLTLSRSIYNFYCYTFIWYRYVLVYLFAEANAPQIRHIASGLTLRAWSSLNDLHNCSAKPQRTTEIRIFFVRCAVACHTSNALPRLLRILSAPQHQRYRSQWRSHTAMQTYSDSATHAGNIFRFVFR